MWNWLVHKWQWPAAALFAAAVLLAVLPIFIATAGWPLALVFIQLPIYMVHQWEEHRGDRFRLYANRVIGGGREALTPAATFWINCLGVWAVDLLAIYAACAWGPGAGLVAGYMAVINGLLHIGPALARREYNPGLVTAIGLLLPLGGWCVVQAGSHARPWPHAASLLLALGVHALVVVYVARRLMSLRGVSTRLTKRESGVAGSVACRKPT